MLKKQAGFTLVEIMISASILLMITIGSFNIIKKFSDRERIDEIAYTTALQIFNFSEIANDYIHDNINNGMPNSFNMNTLINEGYIDDNVGDIHILPFGRELEVYINNDYGFPLSIGMLATGNMNEGLLTSYNMDNEFNRLSYEQKVAAYLSEMVKNMDYNIGIIDPDYKMKWLNSNTLFDLNPFIDKNTTNISNKHSTALFFNLQEEPGYYVLNLISAAYQNSSVAQTSSDSSLYTVGYSSFCPEPNIKMNAENFNNTISTISLQSTGDGDSFSNIYVCIPSSQMDLEDHIEKRINLTNQFHENISIYDTKCMIMNSRSNIVEFRLRNNYYSLQTSSGRVDLQCYRAYQPTYHAFKINNNRIMQSSRDISLSFSSNYTGQIPNISINRINLNEL
jgi:Tfp pilus assembly major pilin PilA